LTRSSIENHVVVVTGAARNIGLAAARSLVARGARVALLGRDAQALDAAAKSLGERALSFAVDITDHDRVAATFDAIARRCGRIDGLVNNAGVSHVGRVESLRPAEVAEQVAVNFVAAVHACKHVIPHLKRQGGGRIVNVSSATVHETMAFAHLSIYSATKAALEHFGKELREEVRGDNIAVTTFVPGNTRTSFGARWDGAATAAAYAEWLEYGTYWGGMMDPEVVGEAIAACFDVPANCTLDFVYLRPVGKQRKAMEQEP
jgi:NAD(P)-dependent dehydrogenase (short-subunit alcohol dehydrogenase family)